MTEQTVLSSCKTGKALLYTLEQIVDDRNRSLYEEINGLLTLTYEEGSDDGEGWGAEYFASKGIGAILVSETDYPEASFTHELLHLKYELEGFRRPNLQQYTGRDPQEKLNVSEWLKDSFVYIYNQLMHYRMFPVFEGLGYKPSEFMRAAPGRIAAIREAVADCKKHRNDFPGKKIPPLFYLKPYLALRNLHDDDPEIPKLIAEIESFAASFADLKDVVDRWIASPKPTVSKYIARIARLSGWMDLKIGVDTVSMVSTNDATKSSLD